MFQVLILLYNILGRGFLLCQRTREYIWGVLGQRARTYVLEIARAAEEFPRG